MEDKKITKTKEIYNEVYTHIYKTNDYDMFIDILGNRKVQSSNYAKLCKSMIDKQLIVPILVNEYMQVCDGQHRFKVCKEYNLPVYYYIVEGYGIQDVQQINQNSSNWDINSYNNMFYTLQINNIKTGNSYIIFNDMLKKYDLKIGALLEIFCKYQKITIGEGKILFTDGSFKVDKLKEVTDFLECIKIFSDLKEYNTHTFIKACLKLYTFDQYKHLSMSQKLNKIKYKLTKRNGYKDYLDLLVNEIYNYGTSKNVFGYDKNRDMLYEI